MMAPIRDPVLLKLVYDAYSGWLCGRLTDRAIQVGRLRCLLTLDHPRVYVNRIQEVGRYKEKVTSRYYLYFGKGWHLHPG